VARNELIADAGEHLAAKDAQITNQFWMAVGEILDSASSVRISADVAADRANEKLLAKEFDRGDRLAQAALNKGLETHQ